MQKSKRCLRSYHRTAQIDHGPCIFCEIPIFAGDYYGANVWVSGKNLWVEKFHIGCPIDPEEDEKERKRKKDKKQTAMAA